MPIEYWPIEYSRGFFESFAKQKGFDPRNSAAWNSVTLSELQPIEVNYLLVVA